MVKTVINIGPQPGPQTAILSTTADIAFFGGGAGGGKSFSLLLEPLRHYYIPEFGGVIFRRSSVQVRNEGGLWSESEKIYQPMSGYPVESQLSWTFPAGSRMKFAHLEHDTTVYDWQGSQIPFIGFDELTHFSERQFVYMMSRNRSMSGIRGYIRGTCNPDVDSWVRVWVDWFIGPDGFPIPERCGKLRWFIRENDEMRWGDSSQELIDKYGAHQLPKSFTFIPSKISDNRILMEKDPSYLANLQALGRVERMRLLEGNWNVRGSAGMYFQREWFQVVDEVPAGWSGMIRYWDRAATKPHEGNRDPDWTRGLKMYKYPNGTWIVVDLKGMRDTPMNIERLIKNTASQDSSSCPIGLEQDPGSSGVADVDNYVRLLMGYIVRVSKPSKDKITRARAVSAQCEFGNVKVLRAAWNEEFFAELENFGEDGLGHDDIVDVLSGAFNELMGGLSLADAL